MWHIFLKWVTIVIVYVQFERYWNLHIIMNNMENLYNNATIQKALNWIKEEDDNTLKETLTMCQIPAPSFMEEAKGDYVFERMQKIGLTDVHKDEVGNVLGILKGTDRKNAPTVMLAAHLDTVFPEGTDLTVKEVDGKYYCPGINDDTRAVAEMLCIAEALIKYDIHGMGDIIFCANVCEEGLGDLRGVKNIFGKKDHGIDAFVSIDNQCTGGVIYTATGSLRYEVIFRGCGGHSFQRFGIVNPIHALGRAIAKISEFEVPEKPKTTFNVGVINGGTSVNTISQSASMLVDLRSDSTEELNKLKDKLFNAVSEAAREENAKWQNMINDENNHLGENILTYEIIPRGDRPAGSQVEDCNIVKTAFKACELVGVVPELRYESSTDANLPISMGIPAITVGRGGMEDGIHTLNEWFSPVESYLGPQKDMLLILALSGVNGVIDSML